MSAGAADRVAAAMQMSRSVIIPMIFRSSFTTGTVPQSQSHMIFATVAKSMSGLHDFTSDVMKSFAVILHALSQM
jgi:hypothetical protein